jgi:hypothetical protein
MGRVIVIEFVSIDGVMEDPDGRGGFDRGGWAFRYGPEAVAGDKFKLGELFDTGALLFGRQTWQQFSRLRPSRDDAFSTKMNTVPKLVASRTLTRVDDRARPHRRVPAEGLPAGHRHRHTAVNDGTPVELELISTEQSGAAALLTYQRARAA